jgi:hypothetical protein
MQQLSFFVREVIRHDRADALKVSVEVFSSGSPVDRCGERREQKVDHRMIMFKVAQHRCQLGMFSLDGGKLRPVFSAVMITERHTESPAVQEKIAGCHGRTSISFHRRPGNF